MPLSLKVPLLAAILMVVVGIAASRQVLTSLGEVQDARLRELVAMHVDGLSVALGPQVLRQDIWEIFDTLDRATTASSGKRMILTVVTDTQGKVLAASDPRVASVGSRPDSLFLNAQPVEDLRAVGKENSISVVAPLHFQGRTVGQIMTRLDVSDLNQQRKDAILYLLIGNTLATGFIAWVGYYAMRRMFHPILKLASHIENTTGRPEPISEAELPRGDPEVMRLFSTYNMMTGAIDAKAETERRMAERERYVSLGRLSSSLAHEINNPLGGLLNATDTILEFADRPDAVRKSAKLIRRGLKHLRDVARATLDQHRLKRNNERATRADVNDLKLLMEPETSRLDQHLAWEVSASEEALRQVPAVQFRQIALNLLLNASAAAGRHGHLGLVVAESQNSLVIKARNDGPGMSGVALKRLMSDEPVQPGGGFGLRIIRELADELGAEIVHDRTNGMTEVSVTIPVRVPASETVDA
jgi:signal transduction histidine kinase